MAGATVARQSARAVTGVECLWVVSSGEWVVDGFFSLLFTIHHPLSTTHSSSSSAAKVVRSDSVSYSM